MKKLMITVVTVLILFTDPKMALAQNYIYLSQDPGRQRADVAGPENYVVSKWADMVSSSVTWKADSAIRPYVVTALSNWTAITPNQTWIEVSSSPNIEFKNSPCPNPASAPGCTDFTAWAGYWTSNTSTPNWNWIWSATVYINYIGGNYNDNAKTSVIAHEIGHIYGLADKYTTTCSSEVTIMDGLVNSGGNIIHCDNLTGPATLDVQRTSAYYATGQFDTFQSILVGSTLKYTWYDLAWADNRHGLYFYYNNGSTWVQYTGPTSVAIDVGLHKQIEARQLIFQIDPGNYGAPHGRNYRACGYPVFPGWNGTWVCSNTTLWP